MHFFTLLPNNKSPFLLRLFTGSTLVVVRSLSSCCPVVVQSRTDNNWTTSGQRLDNDQCWCGADTAEIQRFRVRMVLSLHVGNRKCVKNGVG